ncbi:MULTISPECIES: hypothetical protein [Haloferax]|uniref:Uncharacterized protein n=1 Tax=Haloferax marinum TaxID=2666143 RepID=A0A6A8G5C6_9EURY|nr:MULTISPECIES: hypothetical protein [Haloferax]KAB1196782.1 hypothetical protein Hfx1150_04295 [Haloferax sp. CBA1150]MRW95792.1 hypothetical protein [Haloferax marinum]
MSSPPTEAPIHESIGVRIAIALFLVVTLVYALLIAQQILLWVLLVGCVVVLWYAARLVVAMEQIATNLERLADAETEESRRAEM